MYRVEYTPKAAKAFQKLPKPVQKTIRTKLDCLAANPLKGQEVKALQGIDAFRLRVGNYRIIYTLENKRLVILVVRVAHRKEVYQ